MKAARFIRIITVAPIMALAFLTILMLSGNNLISKNDYVYTVVFLTVLPISAYPLQRFLPGYKKRGREGQRSLAIVMAVIGYFAGVFYAFITKAPSELWIVYLTYLLSGIGVLIFNKILKIRASGHACGVIGPLCMEIYFLGLNVLPALVIVPLVFWASIKTGRHRYTELLWGSCIPVLSLLIAVIFSTHSF